MSSVFVRSLLVPRLLFRAAEDWWFDTTRRVKTAGNAHSPTPAEAVGAIEDSYIYAPVRVPNAHAALRALPVNDFSDYTFVDIGSGKGRMLFIAAEYPFQRVIGVEFATELHDLAKRNIARYRHRRRRSESIESLNENAADFEFPSGKLVVYMFNSFGPKILGRLLDNLEQSLVRDPRHVVVLMLWPEHSKIVAERPWLKEISKTQKYHAFQTSESQF